jgi:hypothetical protein
MSAHHRFSILTPEGSSQNDIRNNKLPVYLEQQFSFIKHSFIKLRFPNAGQLRRRTGFREEKRKGAQGLFIFYVDCKPRNDYLLNFSGLNTQFSVMI